MIKNMLRSAFILLKLLITSCLRLHVVVVVVVVVVVMRKEMNEHGHQRTDEHSWLLLSWLAAYAFLPVHSAAAAANLAAPFPLSLLHPSR
jgi:surface polysaccharide O-acyltransferase-like enzyme